MSATQPAPAPTPSVPPAAEMPHPDRFLPHGYCYLWDEALLTTHLVADLAIGIAYVAISFALAYLVHRARKDIPFSVVFVAFGLFIITCGMTHFMEVWTLWQPVYWLSGFVKVVTATASVTTALAMPVTVPRVLTTIREARVGRERAVEAARAAALEERNEQLTRQAVELERQTREARALAAALERTNAELQHALADADAARHLAEEANQAKGRFLAVMSHELRTPLNAIGGYADLLAMELRGPVSEGQRADLARIKVSQQHLLGVISDILNYARLEAGTVQFRHERVAVARVVADVTALVEPQARAKGLALVTELPPASHGADDADDPPDRTALVAEADEEKVRQVLVNLLSNAVKFTQRGQVTVRAVARGATVAVEVLDTGRGVPPDQLERIFEPFVQVETGLTRTNEGTGLGLAISLDLARRMGGTLVAESTLGVGSRFTLTLPRAIPAPATPDERRAGDDRRAEEDRRAHEDRRTWEERRVDDAGA